MNYCQCKRSITEHVRDTWVSLSQPGKADLIITRRVARIPSSIGGRMVQQTTEVESYISGTDLIKDSPPQI